MCMVEIVVEDRNFRRTGVFQIIQSVEILCLCYVKPTKSFKTSDFQIKVQKCKMYFGQSYLECSAWCLSVCHQKNEQNGKSNSEEYGRKKVSSEHWTSTKKLSIMGPNQIWIRISYFILFSYSLDFTSLNISGSLGLILAPIILERDISAQTFHHGDFSAWGHFVTRTFQHWHFGTVQSNIDISAQTFWAPQCQNVHSVEKCPCRNVLVPKNSCDEISMPKCL